MKKNLKRFPSWQTWLGRKTNYDRLNTSTPDFVQESYNISLEELDKLKSFDRDQLDEKTKLSYDIFKYQREMDIQAFRWRYHSFPMNQMFGFQSSTPSFLIICIESLM